MSACCILRVQDGKMVDADDGIVPFTERSLADPNFLQYPTAVQAGAAAYAVESLDHRVELVMISLKSCQCTGFKVLRNHCVIVDAL